MANHYDDATGVLHLDRVTPVIDALFGGFKLDASYPGDGKAYIAHMSEESGGSWGDVLEGLTALAAQLGLAAPGAEAPDGDEESPITAVLWQLARHFGADENEELAHLIEHYRFEDDADLQALFLIAACFDDGHHLAAIEFEGCWHCSKPRLFEFGGHGCYLSREVEVFRTSSSAREIGQGLREAVAARDDDAAAALIAREARNLLDGIQDEPLRQRVARRVALRLSESSGIDSAA